MSARITVQCDRCKLGGHTYPPHSLPVNWETNLLGEVLCPLCVERAAERAGHPIQVEEDQTW